MRNGILVALIVWSAACSEGAGPTLDAGLDGALDTDAAALGLGEACASEGACASGFCVDGVCCDSACDGACAACGGDGVCGAAPEDTECRPTSGACDVAETCDGVSLVCPADLIVTSETICRPSVGACDAEELFDGISAECPIDVAAPEGTVCREAAEGSCDETEYCSGTSTTCPNDLSAPEGTTCGNYFCSGGSPVCPTSCASHADCANGTLCADNVCRAAKWAFVTSGSSSGDLGGLAGADAQCQAYADFAGLSGNYRAWLADATGSPSTRFARSSVPYVMPAGATALVLANDYADLTDGTLVRNFSQNELSQTVTSGAAYTNVSSSGGHLSSGQNCLGWTSSNVNDSGGNGTVASTTSTWTNGGSTTCNASRRLFCFEQ